MSNCKPSKQSPLKNGFPKYLKPYRLAEVEEKLEGELALSGFLRLLEHAVVSKEDIKDQVVKLSLHFRFDREEHLMVEGNFSVNIPLICQRCAGTYEPFIQEDIALAIVMKEEQIAHLPSEVDPFLLSEDRCYSGKKEAVSVIDLVEDDLLLALPVMPNHPEGQCLEIAEDYILSEEELQVLENGQVESSSAITDKVERTKKPNPFAVLARLKTEKGSN